MTGIHVNDGTVPFAEAPFDAGDAKIGTALVASGAAAGLTATPMTYAWTRDGTVIPGATGRRYATAPGVDAYSTIAPRITDATGAVASPAAVVVNPVPALASFTIALAGPANVGQPCTFTTTGTYGEPHAKFLPKWTVGGVPVGSGPIDADGVSNLYYTFRPADQGKPWTLTVDAVNLSGRFTSNTLSGTVGAAGAIAPSGLRNPMLSVGTNDWTDYNDECPLIDWSKTARVELKSADASVTPWLGIDRMRREGVLDATGWLPNGIPAGFNRMTFGWATGAYNAYLQTLGSFLVLWEGVGTVTGETDLAITQLTPNSARITSWGTGNCSLQIRNMGTGANRFRNLRVLVEKWKPLHDAGEIFSPDFLDTVMRNKREIRFLGWNKMNTNNAATIADITPDDFCTYNTNYGAPLAIQSAIGNRARCDVWVFAPLFADDALVRHIATHFRDNLHPDLCCYTEYCNENWNSGIGRYTPPGTTELRHKYGLFADWATAKFSQSTLHTNVWAWVNQWIGMRCKQVAKIVNDVYAGQPKRRWCNTINCQTVPGGIETVKDMLDTRAWQELYPEEFIPHTVIDALACTTYVGTNMALAQHPDVEGQPRQYIHRPAIIDAYDPNTNESDILIRNLLFDPNGPDSIPKMKNALALFRALTGERGLQLIIYEGGFHMVMASGDQAGWVGPLHDALFRFADSPQGDECTAAIFDITMALTDGPKMFLNTIGNPSYYGDWAMYAPGYRPKSRGRVMESMAMTRANLNVPATTDDRYLRPAG